MRKQGTAPNPSRGPALGSVISTRWGGRGSGRGRQGGACPAQSDSIAGPDLQIPHGTRPSAWLWSPPREAAQRSPHGLGAHRPGLQAPPGAGAPVGGGRRRGDQSAPGGWAPRPSDPLPAPRRRRRRQKAGLGCCCRREDWPQGSPRAAPRPGFRWPRGEKVTGPDSAETGGVFSAVWVWSPASPAAAGRPGPGPYWERRAGSLRKETRGLNFAKSLPKLFRDVYRAGSMGTIQNAGFG